MNYIDIILAVILLIAAIKGFRKGFIHQAASLIAWIIGIFLAIKISKVMVPVIHPDLITSLSVAKIMSFLLVLIVVVIAILFAGKVIEKFFEDLNLSGLNRLAGLVFSLIKTLFILSVIMILIHISIIRFNWPSKQSREKSILYQPIESFAPIVFPYLSRLVESDSTQNK